jgi:hypothetical protein
MIGSRGSRGAAGATTHPAGLGRDAAGRPLFLTRRDAAGGPFGPNLVRRAGVWRGKSQFAGDSFMRMRGLEPPSRAASDRVIARHLPSQPVSFPGFIARCSTPAASEPVRARQSTSRPVTPDLVPIWSENLSAGGARLARRLAAATAGAREATP